MRTGRASRRAPDHLSSAWGEITSLTGKEKEGRHLSNDKGEEGPGVLQLHYNICMMKNSAHQLEESLY